MTDWIEKTHRIIETALSKAKRPAVLCVGGVWQACQTSVYQANNPAYEGAKELSCDGLDNDCNGETDEDFSMTGLDGTTYTGINKKCGAGQCNRGWVTFQVDPGLELGSIRYLGTGNINIGWVVPQQ